MVLEPLLALPQVATALPLAPTKGPPSAEVESAPSLEDLPPHQDLPLAELEPQALVLQPLEWAKAQRIQTSHHLATMATAWVFLLLLVDRANQGKISLEAVWAFPHHSRHSLVT